MDIWLMLQGNTLRNRILLALSAAILYGVLNWACSGLLLPGAPAISLRPQIAVPITVGLVFGPFPGFITGFLGNILGDFMSGYGLTFWGWSIGNGLVGAIPGLVYLMGIRTIESVSQFGIVQLAIVIGNLIGLMTGTFVESLALQRMDFQDAVLNWLLPGLLTNVLLALAIVPVLLIVLKRMTMTIETRTMLMMSFLLVVSILTTTTVLISRANNILISMVPTGAVSEPIGGTDSIVSSSTLDLLRWAGLVSVFVLLVGMFTSVFLVRRITSPVSLLCAAAQRVKTGEYNTGVIDPVARRSDELGQLAKMFQDMAYKVYNREQDLKRQIKELKIVIDKVKEEKQVTEITESDYFRKLQQKSRELRTRKRGKDVQ